MTTSNHLPVDFSHLDHGTEAQTASVTQPTAPRAGRHWQIYTTVLAILLLVVVLTSGAPLATFAEAAVALLPAALSLWVILRLSGSEMPKGYLIEQAFFGAVPGFLGALLVEGTLVFFAVLTFMREDILRAQATMKGPVGQDADLPRKIAREMGAVKVVVLALLLAYVVAAGVEETTKLLIGLRAKRHVPGGSHDAGLSPQSVVAAVMAGALGLAAVEHIVYTVKLFGFSRKMQLSSYVLVFVAGAALSLGRAMLAFPVHCGTALLIGVAIARRAVLREDVRIWPAFVLAVFVHGSFDAVSMVVSALITSGVIPASVGAGVGVIVADVACTVGLMMFCRRAYKSLGSAMGYASVNSDSAV